MSIILYLLFSKPVFYWQKFPLAATCPSLVRFLFIYLFIHVPNFLLLSASQISSQHCVSPPGSWRAWLLVNLNTIGDAWSGLPPCSLKAAKFDAASALKRTDFPNSRWKASRVGRSQRQFLWNLRKHFCGITPAGVAIPTLTKLRPEAALSGSLGAAAWDSAWKCHQNATEAPPVRSFPLWATSPFFISLKIKLLNERVSEAHTPARTLSDDAWWNSTGRQRFNFTSCRLNHPSTIHPAWSARQ